MCVLHRTTCLGGVSMRKNKLTHLLEPSLRLYFVFLLLFAAVSALFSVVVAVI